ncbi:TetR/AcrR family transcriptional regulator [Microbacterium oxydans]|uniref:TetR/AcrR family transcriptional regulator n=1 Tax=Microbacterium oxydans TaxID=82380 RepID=UPI00362A271A
MTADPWHRGRRPRDAIIETAIRVFTADGYAAGSLNTIARHLGITRQLLLHYFPSKDAILVAVLEEVDRRPPTRWPDGSRRSMMTVLDDIDQLFSTVRGGNNLVPLKHRLAAEATDARHPAYDWLVLRRERNLGMLQAVYAAAIERGELPRDVDAYGLAMLTLEAVQGIERQRLADPYGEWGAAVGALRRLLEALVSESRKPRQ